MYTSNYSVTVFTPIFNRASTIKRVYESLSRQTNKDFEWLLINDGSTDETDRNIREILKDHDGSFDINYISRDNMGLMPTINQAVSLASGKFFFRLDSDDYAVDNAIQSIVEQSKLILNDDRICGITFLSLKDDGTINGYHPFENNQLSDFTSYRAIHHATGDRAEVCKVSVLRSFSFPKLYDEKFCPEGLIWNRMAKCYKTIYIPYGIYVKGESQDSITSSIYNFLKKNSNGTSLYYYEIVTNSALSYKYRFINSIKYFRYAFFSKRKVFKNLPFWAITISFPLSLIVLTLDKLTK